MWRNIYLSKEMADPFKRYLRLRNIYFEPSSCGNGVHFEIKITIARQIDDANKFLDDLRILEREEKYYV